MNLSTLLLGCVCPNTDPLDEIPADVCPEWIGQIQKYLFVKDGEVIWDSGTPANNIPASIAGEVIEDATGWNTLRAAINDTKVVATPLIAGDAQITPGAAITQGGGDNTTRNGATLINGYNPSDVQARFDGLSSAQIAAMDALECHGLEVYMVNQFGKILHKDVAGIKTGFPVLSYSLGDKANNGLATRDNNLLTFQLERRWDKDLAFATPSAGFNPLNL